MTVIYIYGINEVAWFKKGAKMKKIIYIFLLLVIVPLISFAQTQETITITTYYPSPYGVYQTLRILNDDEEIMLGDDSNHPAIELRDRDGDGGRPYIDFSNNPTSDYNVRLQLSDTNDFTLRGGRTTFMNNDGSPATIRVGSVWYCLSY